MTKLQITKDALEELYNKYNRREYVHPDPLEFLYNYPDPKDYEITGLIASSLAYGRVNQILRSVSFALNPMGSSPYTFLMQASPRSIRGAYAGFKHRFTTDEDLANLLLGIKKTVKKYGSLNNCFMAGYKPEDETILPALSSLVDTLAENAGVDELKILPSPVKGSACKRLNLYLRWMVRSDAVDPGGWHDIPSSKLIVPLDTHMHKIALVLGLTQRKQANLKTALEISSAFARISPQDPVKYDFALTRFGIRNDMEIGNLFET